MKKALVLAGDGINCQNETAFAAEQAGFYTDIVHINDLIVQKFSQSDLQKKYQALFLPGGFSFGDHLTSGKVLALKIKYHLQWNLLDFASNGGLVLGICNGFQALIRLGVFGADLTITRNDHGRFINKWVGLKTQNPECVFLKNISILDLPIRHGEGRIIFSKPHLEKIALVYQDDVNGSQQKAAGLTTAQGRVLGLMPHPEAAIRKTQNPTWTQNPELKNNSEIGLELFRNAYAEATCL
ncbi:MAG: phosphoribosylformylglycinamidine synthase subunit PurQ [Pseudobdellovibrionaceae bacterium]